MSSSGSDSSEEEWAEEPEPVPGFFEYNIISRFYVPQGDDETCYVSARSSNKDVGIFKLDEEEEKSTKLQRSEVLELRKVMCALQDYTDEDSTMANEIFSMNLGELPACLLSPAAKETSKGITKASSSAKAKSTRKAVCSDDEMDLEEAEDNDCETAPKEDSQAKVDTAKSKALNKDAESTKTTEPKEAKPLSTKRPRTVKPKPPKKVVETSEDTEEPSKASAANKKKEPKKKAAATTQKKKAGVSVPASAEPATKKEVSKTPQRKRKREEQANTLDAFVTPSATEPKGEAKSSSMQWTLTLTGSTLTELKAAANAFSA